MVLYNTIVILSGLCFFACATPLTPVLSQSLNSTLRFVPSNLTHTRNVSILDGPSSNSSAGLLADGPGTNISSLEAGGNRWLYEAWMTAFIRDSTDKDVTTDSGKLVHTRFLSQMLLQPYSDRIAYYSADDLIPRSIYFAIVNGGDTEGLVRSVISTPDRHITDPPYDQIFFGPVATQKVRWPPSIGFAAAVRLLRSNDIKYPLNWAYLDGIGCRVGIVFSEYRQCWRIGMEAEDDYQKVYRIYLDDGTFEAEN